MSKKIIVIGAGFAGLAAAASLAQKGHAVTVVEKNKEPGGRARVWKQDGFVFDMGPSFYWMPDVFERFFARFGQRTSDHYDLVRLDPSYKVVFGAGEEWAVPAGRQALRDFFESKETGAAEALERFLAEAKVKYDLGMGELVYRPSLNWMEYAHPGLIGGLLKTKVFRSLRKHVQAHFKHPHLRSLMEFPVLFLGAAPQNTPALYSLMNYADLELGTWYPKGGMGRVVEAMVKVATELGVQFRMGEAVERIEVDPERKITGVLTSSTTLPADLVVAGADYHHVEQELLPLASRNYSENYWQERTMAPSSLLFFLGFDRKLDRLAHHTLFFDEPLDLHSSEIYDKPEWPSRPLFYTSCASKTDDGAAPTGHENLVILIPIAPGLEDRENIREQYYNIVMERLGQHVGFDPRPHVVLKRSYCINDLKADYNAFRGNAYGLANTIMQTGPLRPSMKSRKVKGLYFTGQLTVPGPGVPPALISGQVVADLIEKETSGQRMRA
ncbi:MAG: phytoene desaturase [Flavobacteriales bacterium]|nr:phytoene desaturase [Flavobacteriales bacterium]